MWGGLMNESGWEKQLRGEGFLHVFVWTDSPDAFYPDHTHPGPTAHAILQGEMSVTTQGQTRTYRAGERFDVPADTVHSARMGREGCRYMVGEK